MTKEEMEQVNMINVYLRDEKGIPMKESFGIAMLIVENKEFISSVISPEIIRCRDCKHNPQNEWFGCPMANLSEQRRPEDAWCWKGEKRTDESD